MITKENDMVKMLKSGKWAKIEPEIPRIILEAMKLYYVDGISKTEISVRLGISRGTVQSRLNKGRYLIKKAVGCPEYDAAYKILYPSREPKAVK